MHDKVVIDRELTAHNGCQNSTDSNNRHGHKDADSESPVVQEHRYNLQNWKFWPVTHAQKNSY